MAILVLVVHTPWYMYEYTAAVLVSADCCISSNIPPASRMCEPPGLNELGHGMLIRTKWRCSCYKCRMSHLHRMVWHVSYFRQVLLDEEGLESQRDCLRREESRAAVSTLPSRSDTSPGQPSRIKYITRTNAASFFRSRTAMLSSAKKK